jgi:hypothetical protein
LGLESKRIIEIGSIEEKISAIWPCGYCKSEKPTFHVKEKTFMTLKYVSYLLKAVYWMRI